MRVSSLVALFLRALILLDQGPILMTSFNLNPFLKVPVSRNSHTAALGFQRIHSREGYELLVDNRSLL